MSKLDELMALVDEHAMRFYAAVKYGGTAESQRAALQDALKAVVEDAERYRWLTEDHPKHDTRARVYEIGSSLNVRGKGHIDAAIDAARKP